MIHYSFASVCREVKVLKLFSSSSVHGKTVAGIGGDLGGSVHVRAHVGGQGLLLRRRVHVPHPRQLMLGVQDIVGVVI